jgi:negative regulator of flagellin synthesis FlgM
MRVNQTNSNQVQGTETKRTGKADKAQDNRAAAAAKGGESAKSSDAVKSDISSRAKDSAKARAVATSAPDVREDKIAELKRRIADGNYKVDAGAVADRMVNEHLAELG